MFSNYLVPDGLTKLKPRLKPRMLKRNKKLGFVKERNEINFKNALVAVSFESDATLAKVFRKIIEYNR